MAKFNLDLRFVLLPIELPPNFRRHTIDMKHAHTFSNVMTMLEVGLFINQGEWVNFCLFSVLISEYSSEIAYVLVDQGMFCKLVWTKNKQNIARNADVKSNESCGSCLATLLVMYSITCNCGANNK